jgi:hypothetical protein
MDITDIKTECESIVKEKLIYRFIQPFSYEAWKQNLIEIEPGFFQVKEKGLIHEPMEQEKEKTFIQ